MDSTWDLVEESSGAFHRAIEAYIEGRATQEDVIRAGKKVMEQWREAGLKSVGTRTGETEAAGG